MHSGLRKIFSFVLRVFFRRIELAGIEQVPGIGALIFVLNHPNALIDPLLVLCMSPRPASFLAKSTLFHTPVISYFVKAFKAIPVYRKQDEGADVSKNEETFAKAKEHLVSGGAIAIFPEGTSHSDPHLKPLKTGAARIALLAASECTVNIVPTGLFYTAKGTFRSEALLVFGSPIQVKSHEEVRPLTERIQKGIEDVTVHAQENDILWIAKETQKLLSGTTPESLESALQLQKRILNEHDRLKHIKPEEVASLRRKIMRYRSILDRLKIDSPESIPSAGYRWARVLRFTFRQFSVLILISPFALFGTLLHYPIYQLIDFLALRIANESDDVTSTVKVLAATLFYPILWIAIALLLSHYVGKNLGLSCLLLCPISAYVALRFWERLDDFSEAANIFLLSLFRRSFFERLISERNRLQKEITSLVE